LTPALGGFILPPPLDAPATPAAPNAPAAAHAVLSDLGGFDEVLHDGDRRPDHRARLAHDLIATDPSLILITPDFGPFDKGG
jgi:hypothetical protein